MNIIEAARSLLGEQVQVGMGGDVIAEGQLLEVGEDGGYTIRDDNGVVHYCWPMLAIESVESAAGEDSPEPRFTVDPAGFGGYR